MVYAILGVWAGPQLSLRWADSQGRMDQQTTMTHPGEDMVNEPSVDIDGRKTGRLARQIAAATRHVDGDERAWIREKSGHEGCRSPRRTLVGTIEKGLHDGPQRSCLLLSGS